MANTGLFGELKNVGIRDSVYSVDEVATAEIGAAGGAEALPITIGTENEDFTHSEALESSTRYADATFLDLEDGVTANYDAAITKPVRVVATAVVDESAALGATAPTEGDLVDCVVYVDGEPVLSSDEGPSEAIDAAVTFNIDGVAMVRGGSQIRVALVSDAAAELADYDVAAAGEFDLVQP